MLKWLFGRKQEASQSSQILSAKESTPVAVEPAQPPTVVATSARSIAVAASPTSPSTATSTQAPKTTLLKHSLSLLDEGSDVEPIVGIDAVAVAPPVIEAATVVKVQAGGRRVVASFGNSTKVRVYSRRADGTYRLEGAPAQSASRLIVGATA